MGKSTPAGHSAEPEPPTPAGLIRIPVSLGELADRLTILQLKAQHLSGDAQRHVLQEQAWLDAELAQSLRCSSDAVDVIDLDRSSYLLQRVVAEHGQPLFERRPGLFGSFCSRAIRQWADWQRRQQKLAAERSQVLA